MTGSRRDPLTLRELPARLAERGGAPAVIAFADGGVTTWSFAELSESSLRLAAGLAADGLAPGETVALYAPARPEWITACLAAAACGAVVAPLDHLLAGEELAAIIADADCRRIFTTRDLLPQLRQLPLEPILLDDDGDGAKGRGWRALLADSPLAPRVADPDETAALFYTSGTTGRPKGVPLSHRNLASNVAALLALEIVSPDQRLLVPLPFHHVYPFVVGLLAPLAMGAAVLIPAGLGAAEIGRALRAGGATAVVGVPRLYESLYAGIAGRVRAEGLLARAGFGGLMGLSLAFRRGLGLRAGRRLFRRLHEEIGPGLRFLVSGGARLEADLEWRLEALGWEVLGGYGLTETAAIATFNPPGRTRPGTVGLPTPDDEIRISRPEGEVQIKGANVFAGYRNLPDETRAAITEDGWLCTGDLGRLDRRGYLTVSGRSKELIVLAGGKNVAPEEVEAVYGEIALVQEIAVLERKGALVALVLPNLPALRAAGTYRIGDALRVSLSMQARRLPAYKRLAGYSLAREALPRTRLGKLRRHLLPALYEHAGKAVAWAPEPLDEAAKALLEAPRSQAVWALMEARFPGQRLSLETSPQLDLGLDSLAWMELVAEIEREAGIRLTEAAISRVVTLGDLLQAAAEATADGRRAAPPARLAEVEIPAADRRWLEPPGPLITGIAFLLHLLFRAVAHAVFRLRVEGLEHLPQSGPVVLASNHVSTLDAPVIAAALPWTRLKSTWWAAERGQVFGNPFFRLFLRPGHAFPVEDRKPVPALAMGARVLAQGRTLVWFPEAWRSPTGELQAFRSGIGRLIAETGVAAVPVRLTGTFEALPRGRLLPRPRRLRVRFGPALAAETLEKTGRGADAPARIAEALRAAVAALDDADPDAPG